MENIHTLPTDRSNYLYANDSNMIRSSSQTFSPLRPNLPQELFKKTTNDQSLVKHIINNKILHSRMNSENCSPSPNHMHSYSDLGATKSPYSPSQFSPSFEGNKLSKELSNISTDTLINMDENEIEHSLLEIEILKSKLMGIKMANGNKTPNYEPDQTFIDNSLHQSNISSNINTNNNITNSSNIGNNSINKTAYDSNESNTTKFYVDVDDDDDYNDDDDDDDDDNQSNNTTQGKKKDYMEDLHLKILSEKNSPSKSSKLSENYVNDSDDDNYFDIHREEIYDKNKTIYIDDYKSPESVMNKNITLISKCENFETKTIDLSTKCYLGRNNNDNLPNYIVFNSLVVSRHHAEMFIENNNLYIIDVGSNGGTFVNKKRINKQGCKSEPIELKSGDIIQLGQDYVESDRNDQLNESVYKSIIFEVSIPKSCELDESKYPLNSIINIYSLDEKNENDLRNVQSESNLSKKKSINYNNINNIVNNGDNKMKREKTRELYDSKLIDESTKYQLELYEKTKDLNEENSIVNSHLLDSLKEEVCLQFFFVIYSDRKKLKRIQILNENTECIFEITLKDWLNKRWMNDEENKGKIYITDKREEYSPTSQIKISKSGKIINIMTENYQLGYIEKFSDMKYDIKTPSQNDSSPQFSITGDFEQHNWLCITKFNDSRKQRCIGEGKGKQLVEKTMKARKWVISVQLETGNYSQLLLSAVTYIIASTGPYY